MLDRFVAEGQLEGGDDGYALTDVGRAALTDLEDDTARSAEEPGAVELHTPETETQASQA